MTPSMTEQNRNADRTDRSIGSFDKTILNALSAHIAILDKNGIILETNQAWRNFGTANDSSIPPDMIDINYLEVCDTVSGKNAEHLKKAAQGIRSVINRTVHEFTMEYPCHSPVRQMWFYMRITRIQETGQFCVVVSHENITPLKIAEETNTALKVLLKQREMDKEELEEKVIANVDQLVMPYVEKIKLTRLDERQKTYLNILESHLNEIVSPFLHKTSTLNLRLTPQEIQVASLVKAGRTTKEIADILNISTNAVDFHRKHIRKKFGLRNQRTNLQSFLMSLK
jgi:DNA-binding CsgD family transcriptional regulator